ncbi:lysophospholipase L1-like esterase [Kitasatospora sp. MAA4]|uniref:SGNH/GDSL hydrolase family protein n=1 Tax=Kitasatospora sp. MAA4 TaxID=3035093 RepID=UPI00247445C5|nr:SGNH/GDSL hydrolase family protein [Kitasatospora sp. MAA4]MDH6131841.1 lysophospholipase L1-like esterase [Kitasatospora sp. MAA4]
MNATPTPAHETTDPHCIADDDAARLLEGAPWRRLVVLGDSIAEGRLVGPCPGYRTRSWPDRLAAALQTAQPKSAYLNLGRRDLVAAEIRSQQLGKALAFRPDLAAVVAGGNDMLRRSFDPDATEAELSRIIGPLRDAGADVITLGLYDVSQSPLVPEQHRAGLRQRLRQLSERTRALALRHGAIHVDLTNHPAGSDRGIYNADGRHANARGQAIAAAAVLRRLAEHLNAARAAGLRTRR